MNFLATPFRQLVERKLWPVAILLIAAVAAVPMLLGEDTADTVTPVAALGTGTPDEEAAAAQPIVTLGVPAEREANRTVLGSRKDPFKPAEVKTAPADPSKATGAGAVGTESTKTTTTPSGAKGSVGAVNTETKTGATTKTGTTTKPGSTGKTTTPKVVTTPTPTIQKTVYAMYTPQIRFGSTSGELATREIRRLTGLPRMAEPKLQYLGLKSDHETAVFLAAEGTRVVGDGKCVPSPTNCLNLELEKGEAAFVDVLRADGSTAAQYELDLVKVLKATTTDKAEASSFRRRIAKGGRDALRHNFSRLRGWEYSPETGTLFGNP